MKIGFNCNLDPALANPMTKLLRPLTILSQLFTVQWQNYSLILCPNCPIPWQFPSFLEQFSSTSMTILTNAPPTHPLPWHSGLISLQKRPIPSHSMTEQNRTVKKMIHPETVLSFHVTFHPHPVTTGSHLVTMSILTKMSLVVKRKEKWILYWGKVSIFYKIEKIYFFLKVLTLLKKSYIGTNDTFTIQ